MSVVQKTAESRKVDFHAIEGMPQQYATATVARLVDAANSAARTRDRTTLLRVANG